MNFIGKLIGVIVGFKFGGFFGAIFGCILGHLADKKLYELGNVGSSLFGHRVSRQSLFMQTTFAVMGHLSKSKGRVTAEDIDLANSIMDRMQLSVDQRKQAQEAFTRGKAADFPIRQAIKEFRIGCGGRSDLLRMFLEIQIQVALSDQELHPNEKEILFIVAEELGYSSFQFEQMLAMIYAARQFSQGGGFHYQYQQYQQQGYQQHSGGYQGARQNSSGPTLEDAYRVLGVSASDEREVVKRAYRKLMNEHHPDKLVAKGLPEEMMEIAKEKAQQIQAAYDLICKVKGWKK
ncbi:co-chaperone DjlA [Gallibacterium melopsittaci]|uniref:Co-chaperone protein DjlA n=1 Tax=Gallibacterium melopsittaci TaxID=516063 RepID=A0ABV6HVL2_9PAST